MRRFPALFALLVTAPTFSMSEPTVAQTAAGFEDVADAIERALVDYDVPSIAVAVAQDGEIVWEQGFGWADREGRIAATEHTMYSLASISKPITTTGLMILVERGLVDLDVPANDYLGDAKINGRAFDARLATVRRVATHTAGLPLHYQFFYRDQPYRRPPMDETIRRYANLVTSPDERWHYSNLGYGILDTIIERVSGRSYPDYMREEVFTPLGLTRTSVHIGDGMGLFAATRYASDQSRIPFYDFDHLGASAVFSSAHDLIRFGMFHLKNRLPEQRPILSDESIDLTHDPVARTSPRTEYGLGWTIRELPGGIRVARHGGGMGGVRTELAIAPDENAALVVLINAAVPLTDYISNMIWATLFPRRVRPTTPPPTGDRAGPPPWGPESPPATRKRAIEGSWAGEVVTYLGSIPLRLAITPQGHVHVKLGTQLWTLLNRSRFDAGTLRGSFSGDLGTEDANRTPHLLSLELRLRDTVMNGSLTALSTPAVRVGNALTHWASVSRR